MLIKTIDTTISTLINPQKISNFYNIWYLTNNVDSEIFILHNIINKFKYDNMNLLLFKIIENPNIIKNVDEIVNKNILNFKKYYKSNLINIPDFFKDNIDNWNLMKKLFNSGKLEIKNGKEEMKFEILKKQINENLDLNNSIIKIWCENYFIKYEPIRTFLNNLGEIVINILTVEKNIDIEFDEISPLLWINEIKQNFLKILKTDNIKEKIIKSFILGRPLNYAIKLDFNNNFYNLHISDIKAYIEVNKNLPNFSNIIFYYSYVDVNQKIYFKLVNNVELEYFTSCLPQIFNKNIFKKILPLLKFEYKGNYILEHKSFRQVNGSNYDQIICYINNNSLGLSPWENDEMPIISNYFKKLRI
jgi:hypothetical protein